MRELGRRDSNPDKQIQSLLKQVSVPSCVADTNRLKAVSDVALNVRFIPLCSAYFRRGVGTFLGTPRGLGFVAQSGERLFHTQV